ncbi:MAG: capsule assembly Wzi family protein [Nitrospirota bacterium]|nr:capsule assembly Wzi family protein [Nitrospirota bacterium]
MLLWMVTPSAPVQAAAFLPPGHPAATWVEGWSARGVLPPPLPGDGPLTWDRVADLLDSARPATDVDRERLNALRQEAQRHLSPRGYLTATTAGGVVRGAPAGYPLPPLPAVGNGPGPIPGSGSGSGQIQRRPRGGDLGLGAERSAGRLTWVARPHLPLGQRSAGNPGLQEGYVALRVKGLRLSAGRQPLLWGHGPHGGLLLSDNAPPPASLRISPWRPHRFSGAARRLGTAGFTLFVARLEGGREIPHPLLAGLRIGWSPHPRVEVGLARTVMAGGRGHSLNGHDWLKILSGRNLAAGVDTSNSLAGVDLALTLPAGATRALRLYGEYSGEDEAGGWPTRPALRGGILLAGLGAAADVALRAEFAATDVLRPAPAGGVWYRHGIYTSGHTYRGRILGAALGPDARQARLEWARQRAHATLEGGLTWLVSGFSTATPERHGAATAAWRVRAAGPTTGAWPVEWCMATAVGRARRAIDNGWEGGVEVTATWNLSP